MLFHRLFRPTIFVLLTGVLASCGGASPPEVSAPAATRVAATATAQPSATATLRPSVTPVPTSTAAPTFTPVPPTATAPPIPSVPEGGARLFPRGVLTARPWTVMIDNHPDAYPQSGLDRAAVVIEGLAEFGITRFMATYADGITPDAAEIGPVRSTRLYFAQLAMSFHPIYGHAGGSPDGEELVRTTRELVNFDADVQAGYSYRDHQRQAPHNLYTSSELLRAFAQDTGTADFDDQNVGYLYGETAPGGAAAISIDYSLGAPSSAASWLWSPADGVYYRSQGGTAHVDRITSVQVSAANVVAMQVDGGQRPGDDKGRIDQNVVGSGVARVFRDGRIVEATWAKDSAPAPLRFYDAAGAEIRFAPGAIWIVMIPSLDRLSLDEG